MHFPQNLGKCVNFKFIEDIVLGSPKLCTIVIFSQTTCNKNLVILAFIGAELPGGSFCPPPPSRAQVNIR